MERATTFLDVLASPTGKWIVIISGIFIIIAVGAIFAKRIITFLDTVVIPDKDRKSRKQAIATV